MGYVGIGEGFKLESVTARQFMLMNYAFHARFGVDIRVTWATRDTAEQIRLLSKYYRRTNRNTGKWWDGSWWEKRPGMTTTVATPGTSRHERGYAADVRSFEWSYNRQMAEWARTNASLYGFAFNVSGEPWHIDRVVKMRITSGRQRALGSASSTTPTQQNTPRPTPIETPPPAVPAAAQQRGQNDMMVRNMSKSGSRPGWAGVLAPGFAHSFSSPENAETAQKFYNARSDYLEVKDWGEVTVLANSCGIPPELIPPAGRTLILKPNS
jgi:hypothetical protein